MLAQWWSGRPEAAKVLHPALPTSPGHEHWRRLCQGAACLVSVVFDERYTEAQVDAFIDALSLFRIGWSWAGPMSLAVPYNLSTLRAKNTWRGQLVRFAVGLESADDLIADCEQALRALPVSA
jgi:cystathionine beta-lyase